MKALLVARALLNLAEELWFHVTLGRVSPERVRPEGTRSPSLPLGLPPLLLTPSEMEEEYGIKMTPRTMVPPIHILPLHKRPWTRDGLVKIVIECERCAANDALAAARYLEYEAASAKWRAA